MTDFFGGVVSVEVTPKSAELDPMRNAGQGQWAPGKRSMASIGSVPESSMPSKREQAREGEMGSMGWEYPLATQERGGRFMGSLGVCALVMALGGYFFIGQEAGQEAKKKTT